MKLDQLIEQNKRNKFLQKSHRKWRKKTSSRPLFGFLKNFIWDKWSAAYFQYISIALNLAYNKSKPNKNFRLFIQRHAQFWFFRKGLGIVSPPHFLYNFSRKMFLILYSINWPNFIVWLPLIFEILGNICIAIVCFLDCDVINSEINLIFLIKPFFHLTRKSWQKFKYLENEKSF